MLDNPDLDRIDHMVHHDHNPSNFLMNDNFHNQDVMMTNAHHSAPFSTNLDLHFFNMKPFIAECHAKFDLA
jgi:hypothetical protein